jgi:hypothetical protein
MLDYVMILGNQEIDQIILLLLRLKLNLVKLSTLPLFRGKKEILMILGNYYTNYKEVIRKINNK